MLVKIKSKQECLILSREQNPQIEDTRELLYYLPESIFGYVHDVTKIYDDQAKSMYQLKTGYIIPQLFVREI